MKTFLSEESIALHKEYLYALHLKYSILQKSVNDIKNKNIREIARQKLPRDVKNEAIELISEIVLHNTFFASFTNGRQVNSRRACKYYGSVAAMLNALYSLSLKAEGGFLCVFLRGERPISRIVTVSGYPAFSSEPVLSVDLCEHAYFLDYGFDKRAYLLAALPHLDLSRLDEC